MEYTNIVIFRVMRIAKEDTPLGLYKKKTGRVFPTGPAAILTKSISAYVYFVRLGVNTIIVPKTQKPKKVFNRAIEKRRPALFKQRLSVQEFQSLGKFGVIVYLDIVKTVKPCLAVVATVAEIVPDKQYLIL